jgi:Protein of unknown function (DUF2384)
MSDSPVVDNPVVAPIALERRSDPEVRKQMSGPAIRAFVNIVDRWGLSVDQQRTLLGLLPASTYHNYKRGEVGTLSFDLLTRISLVLGIFKALQILYPDFADRWMKLPNSNPMFAGKTPIDQLTADPSIDALYRVRRLLDARRGGWN